MSTVYPDNPSINANISQAYNAYFSFQKNGFNIISPHCKIEQSLLINSSCFNQLKIKFSKLLADQNLLRFNHFLSQITSQLTIIWLKVKVYRYGRYKQEPSSLAVGTVCSCCVSGAFCITSFTPFAIRRAPTMIMIT